MASLGCDCQLRQLLRWVQMIWVSTTIGHRNWNCRERRRGCSGCVSWARRCGWPHNHKPPRQSLSPPLHHQSPQFTTTVKFTTTPKLLLSPSWALNSLQSISPWATHRELLRLTQLHLNCSASSHGNHLSPLGISSALLRRGQLAIPVPCKPAPPLLQSPGFTSICVVDPQAVPALHSPSRFLSDRRCHHRCFPQTPSSRRVFGCLGAAIKLL